MLLSLEELLPDLRCPATGEPLRDDGDALATRDGARRYRKIRGVPVLIDFTRSILDEDELAAADGRSAIARPGGAGRRWIKRRLLHGGADERAARAADRVLAEAKALAAGAGETARAPGSAGGDAGDAGRATRETPPSPAILIVGGGSRGIGTRALYEDADARIASFDVYVNDLAPVVADAHAMPFPDAHFDAVWIQYVLEHVLEPWTVAGEIARVLKPGGIVYAETPFLQPVHEGAHDFVRFTHSGHRWLFRDFDELESGIAMGAGPQWLVTWEQFVRGLTRSRAIGQAAKLAVSWATVFERAIPERFRYDAASSFSFLGRRRERPIEARSMTAYYRGAGR